MSLLYKSLPSEVLLPLVKAGPWLPSPTIIRREQFGDLLNLRGLRGPAVEIGTHLGQFAEKILERWEGGPLWCVDPWQQNMPDYHDCVNERDRAADYREAMGRLERFGDRAKVLRTTSRQAAALFPAASLDFVYIDGNHDRKYLHQDIFELWHPRLRVGGVLAGHDLDGYWAEHTQPCIRELVQKTAEPVFFVTGDAASWYQVKR